MAEAAAAVEVFDREMLLVPLEDPTKCPHAKEWDGITFAEWQAKNIKSKEVITLLNFLLWTIFTVTAEEISYFWWLYYLRQGHGYTVLSDIRGGAQQDKVEGGLMQVCERLVDQIGADNVKLRAPVREILQKGDGHVEVVTSSAGTFHGSYVIVTAPPSVCEDIYFSPPLSAERQQLHKLFRAGTVIKVYVCYQNWWWRERGWSGEMLSDEEPVTLYYDATTEKVPAFIGFIPAHHAKKWGNVSSDELKQAIIKQLVREFGPDAASPLEVLIRPWLPDDVWCKGAYAGSMGKNVLSKYGHVLRVPSGNIHWAGTELALDWCGYFEGAVESGERAALEVQKKLAVKGQAAKL